MKLGSTYEVARVSQRDFGRLAAELELDPERVLVRARTLTQALRDSLPTLRKRARLEHPLVERLFTTIDEHAKRCARVLDS